VDTTASPRPAVATTDSQRDRRQRILLTATRMLEGREYERIQIRDVADEAGVALGTLYRYFPSKEQLFAHVLLEWASSFEAALDRRRPAAATDAERLKHALHGSVRAFEKHPNFFALIPVLEVVQDPQVAEPYAAYAERVEAALAGTLVDTAPEDREVITTTALALLGSLLRRWSHGRYSLAEVRRRLDRAVDLLLRTA
jgi:AcrR family transcriptional regulator